jgi:hypothetical protein
MNEYTEIEVWTDEDVVADTDITSSGQDRINLFLVDFFDPKRTVMVHMGPRTALEIIKELQLALIDLAGIAPSEETLSDLRA